MVARPRGTTHFHYSSAMKKLHVRNRAEHVTSLGVFARCCSADFRVATNQELRVEELIL